MSWVAERNAQIVALRKEGLWPTQIADQMGLNRNQVLGALFRAGMCSKDTDRRVAMRIRSKLTDDAVAYIRKNYVRGCGENGCRSLARRFGVSESLVVKVIRHELWRP